MREEEKRIGALIIPASGGKEMPDTGTVLAVGEGKMIDGKIAPMRIRVGDRVMFSKYSYDEVTINGEILYILKEENVLAIIN
jgi:chaperonin GroES